MVLQIFPEARSVMIHRLGENQKDRFGLPINKQEVILIFVIRRGKKNTVIIF
jgi:hypothetical protein